MITASFDIAIVGAGIVGLAHALAALRQGLRVAVVDREARAVGASVRNFGFITVTGQEPGATWRRARRSRDVWAEIAEKAGIAIHQRGLLMVARRSEAMAVLEDFVAGPMGADCRLLDGAMLRQRIPVAGPSLVGALQSPHELRVESRDAVPLLAAWLEAQGVAFLRGCAVRGIEPGAVIHASGRIGARHVVICPGPDLVTLYPEVMARRGITLCKLHMLRLADPGVRFPAPLMSDLGLVRYLGYQGPRLPALRARLEAEQPAHLADGIHLIAVQHADGSMVVGDSHHYDASPDPFQAQDVDARMLEEFAAVTGLHAPAVTERWIGIYPSGPDVAFTEAVADAVRLVMVTSGTGASTAFAIGEETVAELLGLPGPAHMREEA
jgi:D-hydroxyproline dehydrogenase subunit beta